MDLSKAIAYNGHTTGLTQNPSGAGSSGVVFNRVSFADIDVDGYMEKRALQDGMDASDVFLGARRLVIGASVMGSTLGDGYDRLQAFLKAYSPTVAYNADTANLGFRAMTFYQPTANIVTWPTSAYPNGIPLMMYVRPQKPPAYQIDRDTVGTRAGAAAAFDVAAFLVARDPRKYIQTQTTSTISTSSQTAANRGDYPTFPIVTFSLSATGHSAFTLTVGGQAVILNLSGTSSGSYTLDYGKRTLVDGAGASKASLFSSVAGFSTIDPTGTAYLMANNTGISVPVLSYYEAFI